MDDINNQAIALAMTKYNNDININNHAIALAMTKYNNDININDRAIALAMTKYNNDNDRAIALAMTKYNNDINIKEKLRDGVFEIQKNFVIPDDLEEENASTADAIVQSYKESKNDLWIQKYMENPNYDILNVESNGDCLFAVIRDAYKENGKKTTVSVLRAIVANELTKSIFDSHRNLYQEFLNEKINLEKEIIEIESPEKKKKLEEELEYCKKNLEEYKHMKNINTIEGYQKYIMTSNYWADAWAILVLEQNLKMKMIIFAEQEYKNGNKNKVNVIQCGYSLPVNVKSFTPEFYIMTSYSGNHYRLISYKRKKLLKFSEIPYHVKILIVKKCLEKNAGIYNLIQDFRDFKSGLHVNEREELATTSVVPVSNTTPKKEEDGIDDDKVKTPVVPVSNTTPKKEEDGIDDDKVKTSVVPVSNTTRTYLNFSEPDKKTTTIQKKIRESGLNPNKQSLEINIKNENSGQSVDDFINSLLNENDKIIYTSKDTYTQKLK